MSRLEELIAELCPDGVEYKRLGDIATDIYIGVLELSENRLLRQEPLVFVMGKFIPHTEYSLMNAFHTLIPPQSAVPNILSMGIFCL